MELCSDAAIINTVKNDTVKTELSNLRSAISSVHENLLGLGGQLGICFDDKKKVIDPSNMIMEIQELNSVVLDIDEKLSTIKSFIG